VVRVLVSELVRRTSVPLATVKYYLREGLLHPGRRITARSAEYDDSHLRRLGLLRILREVGGIPVGRLRALVEASEDPRLSIHEMFGRATDALASAPGPAEPGPHRATAEVIADRVTAEVGWSNVRADAVDRENLVRVIEVLLGRGHETEQALAFYAETADRIARVEIASLDGEADRVTLLEDMVVGTVVFGELLGVLRRLAEEHHSAQRFRGRH
jgi:DNA-binding transcriptional MerR regulator